MGNDSKIVGDLYIMYDNCHVLFLFNFLFIHNNYAEKNIRGVANPNLFLHLILAKFDIQMELYGGMVLHEYYLQLEGCCELVFLLVTWLKVSCNMFSIIPFVGVF